MYVAWPISLDMSYRCKRLCGILLQIRLTTVETNQAAKLQHLKIMATKSPEKSTKSRNRGEKNNAKSKTAFETHGQDEPGAGVKKQKAEFTFFYSSASPFSQHHESHFEVDGVQYMCAEMYMMHQKAVQFGDEEIAKQILVASTPGAMKALGRKVKNFDDAVWKEHRRSIVKKGSMAKFSQNAHLKEQLLATRDTTLVEASPRDRIWGIGLGQNNPKALDKKTWRGQNLLGYILTEVREEIEKADGNN